MAKYNQPPWDFNCLYEYNCPYLRGLSTKWVWAEYQRSSIRDNEFWRIIDLHKERLEESSKRIKNLQKENDLLKAKLLAVHRKQFKSNTRKKVNADSIDSEKKTNKRGAPLGHPGWFRSKPKRFHQSLNVFAPNICPHCNSKELLSVKELKVHLQEDIILEPKTVVTRFLHHQAYCKKCNREVIQAAPNELLNAPIGPVTKSAATYLRYRMGLSYRNIRLLFDEFFGMKFVPASALGFDKKAATKGKPLYEDLREKIKASEFLHADETGWRNNGINHHLWFAGNPDLAFFHIDRHRSSDVAKSIIGSQFDGILITDGYAAYNPINSKARQACLAHLLRNAQEIIDQIDLQKSLGFHDKKARRFCEKIIKLFKTACDCGSLIRSGRIKPEKLPLLKHDFLDQLQTICKSPLQHHAAEKFRKRIFEKEIDRLFTFLTYPYIQPTNNHAEQSLRPAVIHRKITFGNRSFEGINNHGILLSLIHTAKRQNQHPRQFLETLLVADTQTAQAALYNDSS
jgi:hypothetical protein